MSGLAHDPRLIASADGTRIAARIMGAGPGIPLLIANGIGGGLSMWRAALADHPDERRILTWDHRGLHDSGPPADGRLEPSRHAEDAIATLDAAAVDRCVVVAWSSGGRIALELAVAHPERVQGLVLVCAGYGQPLGRLLHRELGPLLPRLAGLAKPFAAPLQGIFERMVTRPEIAGLVRQSGFVGPSADTGALIELLGGLAECDTRMLLASYQAVSGSPAPDLLSEITAPALVIAGERDRLATTSMMTAIKDRLDAARYVVYENATHLLPIEHPARLSADLRSFCSEVEAVRS